MLFRSYLGVPSYTVRVRAGEAQEIPVRSVDRIPRYGARVNPFPLPYPYPAAPMPPAGSQPLLGGTLVASIDGRALSPTGRYDVVVGEKAGGGARDGEKAVARLTINLATLR